MKSLPVFAGVACKREGLAKGLSDLLMPTVQSMPDASSNEMHFALIQGCFLLEDSSIAPEHGEAARFDPIFISI